MNSTYIDSFIMYFIESEVDLGPQLDSPTSSDPFPPSVSPTPSAQRFTPILPSPVGGFYPAHFGGGGGEMVSADAINNITPIVVPRQRNNITE